LYSGRSLVLKGVTLDIHPGERVAIVGTSGNGKSTLLKMINRFYDPTEGVIRLDGIPLPRLSYLEAKNGGLALYGRNAGRYPIDLIIRSQ
jgi:ATP-binding cassette subfamily B protein